MCVISQVNLICGCNLILHLRNRLTRLGFQAFVLLLTLLVKGGVSKVCVCVCVECFICLGYCSAAMRHTVCYFHLLLFPSESNNVNQALYFNLHRFLTVSLGTRYFNTSGGLSTMCGHSELLAAEDSNCSVTCWASKSHCTAAQTRLRTGGDSLYWNWTIFPAGVLIWMKSHLKPL